MLTPPPVNYIWGPGPDTSRKIQRSSRLSLPFFIRRGECVHAWEKLNRDGLLTVFKKPQYSPPRFEGSGANIARPGLDQANTGTIHELISA